MIRSLCRCCLLLFLIAIVFGCKSGRNALMQNAELLSERHKVIDFAGYRWVVKQRDFRTGPGDNFWSDSSASVWKAEDGIHLKLRYEHGKWLCAEIYTEQQGFGYGEYRFTLKGRYDWMDENVIVGLFTYEHYGERKTPQENEIDIEFSKWGNARQKYNSQYGFQFRKAKSPVNQIDYHYFKSRLEKSDSTLHSFNWQHNRIDFSSQLLLGGKQKKIAAYRLKSNKTPKPGLERVHINIWLKKGSSADTLKTREIVLTDFRFVRKE